MASPINNVPLMRKAQEKEKKWLRRTWRRYRHSRSLLLRWQMRKLAGFSRAWSLSARLPASLAWTRKLRPSVRSSSLCSTMRRVRWPTLSWRLRWRLSRRRLRTTFAFWRRLVSFSVTAARRLPTRTLSPWPSQRQMAGAAAGWAPLRTRGAKVEVIQGRKKHEAYVHYCGRPREDC